MATQTGSMSSALLHVGKVGVGLVVFTAIVQVLADITPAAKLYDSALIAMSPEERIAPVGMVRTAASAGESEAMADAGGAPKTAEELYNGICSSCHAAGVAGAPAFDNRDEWAKRAEVGIDALVSSVVNGKGAMPPKGGSAYSEDEIRSVVEYLVAGGATDAAAPAAEEAPAEELAAEETPAAAPTEEAAEAPAEETATEEPVEEVAAEDASTEEVAAEAAPAEAAAAPVAVADIPDNIKKTVDTMCAACHVAGVAGAPKWGDAADWGARAERGVDAMLETVINGKAAMPPRGGTQLTDDELRLSVEYMLTKQ